MLIDLSQPSEPFICKASRALLFSCFLFAGLIWSLPRLCLHTKHSGTTGTVVYRGLGTPGPLATDNTGSNSPKKSSFLPQILTNNLWWRLHKLAVVWKTSRWGVYFHHYGIRLQCAGSPCRIQQHIQSASRLTILSSYIEPVWHRWGQNYNIP